MKPLTPQQPFYPTELRRRLETAEEKLRLQDQFIIQSRALLELTKHLQQITT